jgi:hypothetical protein
MSRYKDFDQPPRREGNGSPYFGPSQVPDIETFGVPAVQDPYADFVPRSSDEEDEDVTADSSRVPPAKRKCKEIAELWSAQVARSNQQSQRGGSRYGGEADADYSGDFRNRGERRVNRRYNRPDVESSVDRGDRSSARRRRRSSDIDDDARRRPSRYRRGEAARCDRGVSTSPRLSADRFNERVLCDQSCGTTPVHYEDEEVQTDPVDEASSGNLPGNGTCRHLSFISDDLQKEYIRYVRVCNIP